MAAAKPQNRTILDFNSINTLRDLSSGPNENFVNEFIDIYRKNSTVLVDEIKAHAETEARGLLRAAAHKLRGSSLNIGGMQVAAICSDLEKRAKKQDMASVMDMVEVLEDAFDALLGELAAVRGE